jgi:serine/threonine protein kinase/Tfp pilus assembly protein PilF
MKLEPGKTISHYKILSKIGEGGMGEVYLAQDTTLDREVALKLLSGECCEDPEKLTRFVQEAKAASALNHPNIITIFEFGQSDSEHYMAIEYVDGKTLTDQLAGNRFALDETLDIAIQIATALEEAHSAGIIHRDIKPDNIMIRRNGLVKILDFGIAKLTENKNPLPGAEDKTAVQFKTTPGMIIGTANYMSPEQAKGHEIDARTDVFSFGVVLYEMISGRLPFSEDSAMETIGAILHKEPEPIDDENVPETLLQIVSKMLEKDPADRFRSITDLREELETMRRRIEFASLDEPISTSGQKPETDESLEASTVMFSRKSTKGPDADLAAARAAKRLKAYEDSKRDWRLAGILSILIVVFGLAAYYVFNGNSKQIDSIAIMPFVNENGDQEIEYLSDGMTETLIGSLSKLPNLDVRPRSTVFRYKGKETDTQTIGKELNVQAILNGRIVQRGDQLTLNLELIDPQKEVVLWSERYNRKQSELVSLQSEIAKDVSTKLKSKLSGEDEAKVTKSATVNPEAYQAYLKGRFYWNKRSGDNLNRAIEQFKAATEKDPAYALAYVGLADSYVLLNQYTGAPSRETLPLAKAFAARAIEIDAQLGEPHATLGMVSHQSWQWREAEREFKRAIELNPNYATAFHWYSVFLRAEGRFDEAAVMTKKAQEIDPLSRIISNNVSAIYLAQNKTDSSIENTRRTIALYPNSSDSYRTLGVSLLKKGLNTEAIVNLEKAVELDGERSRNVASLSYGYALTGKRTEAKAILKKMVEIYAKKKENGVYIAAVYAGLGEKDKAFEWLESEFQIKGDLTRIRWELVFEPLRDDPRYKDLIRRMGLPD